MEFTQDHVQGSAIFPDYPIIFRAKDGQLHLKLMSWSCLARWVKEKPDNKDPKTIKLRNGYLNARSERILDDPSSLWYKIKDNRCLIPVSGILEHRGVLGWKKSIPYHVRPKDQKEFFLPALYSVNNVVDKDTGELVEFYSFALITEDANELMRMIHNSGDNPFRMPLFLPFAMAMEFISPDLSEQRYREILAYKIPSEDLAYHSTFTIRSSKPHPLGLRKHEPYEWPGQPPLGEKNPEIKMKE